MRGLTGSAENPSRGDVKCVDVVLAPGDWIHGLVYYWRHLENHHRRYTLSGIEVGSLSPLLAVRG